MKTETPNIDINKQINWWEEIPINTNQAQLAHFSLPGLITLPGPLSDWSPHTCMLMRPPAQNLSLGFDSTQWAFLSLTVQHTRGSGHLVQLVWWRASKGFNPRVWSLHAAKSWYLMVIKDDTHKDWLVWNSTNSPLKTKNRGLVLTVVYRWSLWQFPNSQLFIVISTLPGTPTVQYHSQVTWPTTPLSNVN